MKNNTNTNELDIWGKINRTELPVDVEVIRSEISEQKNSILEQSLDQIVDSTDNKKTH